MNCPECGQDNREGAKFCDGCGAQLAVRCGSCGTELRAPGFPEEIVDDEEEEPGHEVVVQASG